MKKLISFGSLIFILLISACEPPMNAKSLNGSERAKQLVVDQMLEWGNVELFLRAFKVERELEVWGKRKNELRFRKIITYPFCEFSGVLGPKRKEGDRQIPEGIYFINRFNPNSKFHLSLGLNYPNKADLFHADSNAPGSDIFIHGGCVTVGCIPITNSKIEELFTLTAQAKALGQEEIPVHIFPARFSNSFYQEQINSPWKPFWKELYPIYKSFESSNLVPKVEVNNQGKYVLMEG